ncbi:MAG TPA: glycosyltransferase family 1 protein [Patescibacteria group bacterium]|jgi:glycosyltransferase involved in cell wall biosynthesis|nr:glycosyltransferase family 1 protein [Patescibacteria group bacterium]
MQKIAIITDTWHPNLNGVVTSLSYTKKYLELKGLDVRVIHPGEFTSIRVPTETNLHFALLTSKQMESALKRERPDYIHIATEGPMGLAARSACQKNKWKFTTFYHTQLPEYLSARFALHKGLTYSYMRWFHGASEKVIVSTQSLKRQLEQKKFKRVEVVALGADVEKFQKNPNAKIPPDLEKPIFVYLGRVAPEKNIEAFLKCILPGSKIVIGDGPSRKSLEKKYRAHTRFVGYKKDQELVDLLSVSDVMVFPSKTDTFGLTILEAMACSMPVAAFDVPGPKDLITHGVDGFLGDDLQGNAIKCLKLDPENCRKKALKFSWANFADRFFESLVTDRIKF